MPHRNAPLTETGRLRLDRCVVEDSQNSLVNESDHVIVGKFAIEYRGVVQYYLMAGDVFRLHRLRWVMETSMLRTLARKHGSTVSKMAARFKAKIQTPYGPRTCFEARMPRDNRKELVARYRRDSSEAAEDGGVDRPSDRSRLSPQGVDPSTSGKSVRGLRAGW